MENVPKPKGGGGTDFKPFFNNITKKEFNNKNIIIVTGGTGGHIYPAITFGKYLTKKYFKVTFITDKRGLANKNLSLIINLDPK